MFAKIRWIAALSALITAWLAAPAFAQEAEPAPAVPPPAKAPVVDYDYVVIPETIMASNGAPTKRLQEVESKVKPIISGSGNLADSQGEFDSYFTKYVFARMTHYDDRSLAKLPAERRAFMRKLQMEVRSAEVHEHLVGLTYRTMKEYVTKNYHPAVRYNAMLIISELNSKEAIPVGAQAALPLPYAEARDFMVGEFFNANQLDAVRVAALLGILRHVDINAHATQQYPPAVRQALVKQFLPVAVDKKVPDSRDAEGHAWMRSRVVEILGALGQAGWDANILQAMVTIVGDKEEPMSLRYVAAASIGRLNMSGSTGMQGDEVAQRLASLAVESSREQLALLDAEIAAEKEKLRLQGGVGEVGRTGPYVSRPTGPGPGESLSLKLTKQEMRLTLNQRLLKDRMNKVRLALTGVDGTDKNDGTMGALTGAKTPPPQQYVKSVRDAVVSLKDVANLRNPIPNQPVAIDILAAELRKKIGELEMVAKAGRAAAPAAAPMNKTPAAAEGPDEGPGAEAAPMKKAATPAPEGPEGPE